MRGEHLDPRWQRAREQWQAAEEWGRQRDRKHAPRSRSDRLRSSGLALLAVAALIAAWLWIGSTS